MKKNVFLGFLVIVLAVGFFGCDLINNPDDNPVNNPDDEDDKPGNPYLGSTLSFNEQVYYETENYTIAAYTGADLSVKEWRDIDGTANITGGKLKLSIGTPSPLSPIAGIFEDVGFGSWQKDIEYSTTDVQAAELYDGELNKPSEFTWLEKRRDTDSAFEHVSYIFVSKDVTVTAKGKVDVDDNVTSTDVTLKLKSGWNVLYFKMSFSNSGAIASYSLSNPGNLCWMLY
ncbi:MAG: hypothetical protein LBN21_13055 [Treponema sp.]|jgi:hypothetical protein|nr:hypothetical protein [Treponema sp.]